MSGFLFVMLAISMFALLCWGAILSKRLLASRLSLLRLDRIGRWMTGPPAPADPVHRRMANLLMLGHWGVASLLTLALPAGENLGVMHEWFGPLAAAFPGLSHLAQNSYDRVFFETFMGMSLVMSVALAWVVACVGIATRRRIRPLNGWLGKLAGLAFIGLFGGLLIYVTLFMPMHPSPGNWRITAVYELATTSRFGTLITIHFLGSFGPMLILCGFAFVLLAPLNRSSPREDHNADDESDVRTRGH